MKEKKILTFKSWENSCEKGTWAIALCDNNDYFVEAINCVRDSQMGDKNKDGVYMRHWIADYIWPDEMESLRPATDAEQELYLNHVVLKEAADFGAGIKKVELGVMFADKYGTHMIITLSDLPWWKKLWNFFKH